ncbi:unnamed protein product [Closterium sp. NIES-65]|nr:unnamed protein product [Closterium sp. NIES-65]
MPRWPLPAASSLFPSPVLSACPLWLPAPASLLAPEFRLPFCSLGDFHLPRTASPSILLAPLSVPTAPSAVRAPPAPPICSSRAGSPLWRWRRSLSAKRDCSFFPLPHGFGACHARWLISGPPSSCRPELSVRRPSSWGSSRPRDSGGGVSNSATATGLVSACASVGSISAPPVPPVCASFAPSILASSSDRPDPSSSSSAPCSSVSS